MRKVRKKKRGKNQGRIATSHEKISEGIVVPSRRMSSKRLRSFGVNPGWPESPRLPGCTNCERKNAG